MVTRRNTPHPGPLPQGEREKDSASAASRPEQIGDRIAPVAAEGAARYLDAGRRLAALIFGAVEHAPDLAHHRLVMAARDDLLHRHFMLDEAFQDVVENGV